MSTSSARASSINATDRRQPLEGLAETTASYHRGGRADAARTGISCVADAVRSVWLVAFAPVCGEGGGVGSAALRAVAGRGRHGLVARAEAQGRRAHDARPRRAGRYFGGAERANPCPRVRRRRLVPPRKHCLLLELRRSAALPPRRRRSGAADHARAARAGLGALRGRSREPGWAADRVRARDPRWGRARERARRPARRRPGRYAPARVRARLLLLPPAQPGRHDARVDVLGPPEHALGRNRALGRGVRHARGGAPGGRRATRVDMAAGVEPRGAAPLRVRPQRLVEPLQRGRPAHRRAGGAGLPAVGLRRVELHVPRGRRHRLHQGRGWLRAAVHPSRGRVASAGPRPSLHGRRLPGAPEHRAIA